MKMKIEPFMNVLSAPNHEELTRTVNRIITDLGFSNFFYGMYSGDKKAERENVATTSPEDWVNYYLKQKYVSIDPRVHICTSSALPFTWDQKMFRHTKATRELGYELSKVDALSGMSVRCHDKHGHLGMLNFSAAEDISKMCINDIYERHKNILFISSGISEVLYRLDSSTTKSPQQAFLKLTPQETICLQWCAEGKTSWEMGNILLISERTVNFHMHNICRKLKVNNRHQAVAKGIANNLISV